MPIYEYKCRTCDAVLEVIQKFSDEPLTTHEGCGGPLDRLIGSPALQFKGSGWYVNDYAKSSGKSGGKAAAGSSESKPESKSESKSDSKPAASSTSKTE